MNNKLKVIAVVGTNSMFSRNKMLLEYMKRRYEVYAEIELFELYNIEPYNEEKALNGIVPERIKELQDKIIDADGVIFGITEYFNSITSTLQTTLEWLSSYPFVLMGKKCMVVADSFAHLEIEANSVQTLLLVLKNKELEADVIYDYVFLLNNSRDAFNKDNELHNNESTKTLDRFFRDFLKHMRSGVNYG